LLAIFSKLHDFGQNGEFSPRTACYVISALAKVNEFVQNSVLSRDEKIITVLRPRAARFVIFALGAPILAIFCKVHEFVENSDFNPR